MTQIQLWNKALSDLDIKAIARCESNGVNSGIKVSWQLQSNWILSNGSTTEVDLNELCSRSPLHNQLIWLEPIGQTVMAEYCEKVNGKMPDLSNLEEDIQNAVDIFTAVDPEEEEFRR